MATVAIVGAGMAGLICGQMLRTAGHQVIGLEKSRGVGGRMATRRLGGDTWVNHGLRHWPASDLGLQSLTQTLEQHDVLSRYSKQSFLWHGHLQRQVGEIYGTGCGVNAIAKYLAAGANIQRQQTVTALTKCEAGWQLSVNSPQQEIHKFSTDAVILAIPAPQAQPLLASLDQQASVALDTVNYSPCLSLMATYGALPSIPQLEHQNGWCVASEHPVISRISLDSSSPQDQPEVHGMVIQSQADIAANHLKHWDALQEHQAALDQLQQATINQLLDATKDILPGLEQPPLSVRLQRWRYSVVSQPHRNHILETPWTTLVCCGDWCNPNGSSHLAAAYTSGIAAANHVHHAVA